MSHDSQVDQSGGLRELPVEIPAEYLDDPDTQRHIAFLRGCAYFYETDPLSRKRIAVHEAAHKIYFTRLGWNAEFGGPKIFFENGCPVLGMGRVVLTGVTDADADSQDRIAVAKGYVAPSVVAPYLIGRNDWPAAIAGDLKDLQESLKIDDVFLSVMVEHATLCMLEDLKEDSFREAIWDSAFEFETQFFKPLSAQKS